MMAGVVGGVTFCACASVTVANAHPSARAASEQPPNSRSLFCLLIKVVFHLFVVLQFSVLFQVWTFRFAERSVWLRPTFPVATDNSAARPAS